MHDVIQLGCNDGWEWQEGWIQAKGVMGHWEECQAELIICSKMSMSSQGEVKQTQELGPSKPNDRILR